MIDPDVDHDTPHVHPPHPPIKNFVFLSVIFLAVSGIWGWIGSLRPIFSHMMCHLTSAERINRDIPLSIVIAEFEHDDSGQTMHAINALSRALQPAIANKDAQIVHACSESRGRRMLEERGARLLGLGKVMAKNVLNLRFLPKLKVSTQDFGRNYTWTEQLEFADEFKSDLGMQIAIVVENMTETPMWRRRISISSGGPVVSEPHKGPDQNVYERIKRIAELHFMHKGLPEGHIKRALGYIAVSLADRQGLGGVVIEAKKNFTQLTTTPACLLEVEFAALVHHHLGDLAMSIAGWEKSPSSDLYMQAVKAYNAALSSQSSDADQLRWGISLQHRGIAYLKLAEQDADFKRAEWVQEARRTLEQANLIFKALRNSRAIDTQLALKRLDDMVAGRPVANDQNRPSSARLQPSGFTTGSQPTADRALHKGRIKMTKIGKLSCDVGPDGQTNMKCEFSHSKPKPGKSDRYTGSINTFSAGASTALRLSWLVYAPQGEPHPVLTGSYQVEGSSGRNILARSTHPVVTLHPRYPSASVGMLELRSAK